MTGERRELSPVEVLEIADALGIAEDKRVWVLAIDPKQGQASTDVLAADNVVWFTGKDLELSSVSKYRTGTLQVTFKRKDRPRP